MSTDKVKKQSRDCRRHRIASMTPDELKAFRIEKAAYDKEYRKKNSAKIKASKETPEYLEWVKSYRRKRYVEVIRPRDGRQERVPAAPPEIRLARIRESYKKYSANRRKDPVARLLMNHRRIVAWQLNNVGRKKWQRSIETLGCTAQELKAHIEKQFQPGMEWGNYGSVWWIDHMKPCSLFDLTNIEDQKICFHYTNLQPMFKIDNIKKGNRFISIKPTPLSKPDTVLSI